MNKRRILIILIAVIMTPTVALVILSSASKRPSNLGIVDGQLPRCPESPNCVSTQASDAAQRMDVIPYAGATAVAMERVKSVVTTMPRSQIITEEPNYLYVEFTSFVFRFVDDVEFYLDDRAKVIHFRSASRAGQSDLGVNRDRMNSIIRALEKSLSNP